MVYLFCSRCSRRREYHWTILLAVILVFLYTYLYNVHVGSQDAHAADKLYGADKRVLPDTREVKLQVYNKPKIAGDLNDKPPEVVYKESQLIVKVDKKLKVLDEVKSNPKLHDDKSQIADETPQIVDQIGDKRQDDTDKLEVTDQVDIKITDPITKMREHINEINEREIIINDDKFPPFDLVMIIQVHRRTEYLKMLLESLRGARNISEVLLLVSFDYYDEELFSIVEKIDFCKVMYYITVDPIHHYIIPRVSWSYITSSLHHIIHHYM